jgi:triacylglycerol esterase/lipase EstA (alpha/beta hydrolase family)
VAARLWRLVLACELAVAAALAAALTAAFSLSAGIALGIALLLSLFTPGVLVAVSFLIAAVLAPRSARVGGLDCLRALLNEGIHFNRAVLAMALSGDQLPAAAVAIDAAAAQRTPRPLLLIHGIVCNRSIWRPWLQRLQAEGFAPIRAVNLEPLFADIEAHALRVEHELHALQRETNGARVAIVAHSMGGLVARAALRSLGANSISRIVTLAAPHHGTQIARWFRWLPVRQMSPDSAWLRALNASQEGHLAIAFTSIYSLHDNLIMPPRSARLDGASMHELHGLGHVGLLSSRHAIEYAVAALAGA